jgi:sugar O-acyltransferase (sialic acid O-acetyltransferase NeuD family)
MFGVTRFVILGAGGFAREVHDVVSAVARAKSSMGGTPNEFIGFLDDIEPDAGLLVGRGAWLGPIAQLESMDADVTFVVGIGAGTVRRRIDEWAESIGRKAARPLIHPSASLGEHRVHIGDGSVICAGVRMTTDITAGRHVHINLNATIGHDAVLGDYVTVNPLVAISGNVSISACATIGTGAAVIQGISIGRDAMIGAGAAVISDIGDGVTAVGIPARPR